MTPEEERAIINENLSLFDKLNQVYLSKL